MKPSSFGGGFGYETTAKYSSILDIPTDWKTRVIARKKKETQKMVASD